VALFVETELAPRAVGVNLAALIQRDALLELAGEVVGAVFIAVTLWPAVVAMSVSAVLEGTTFGVETTVDPYLLALGIQAPRAVVTLVVVEAVVGPAFAAVCDAAFAAWAVPVIVTLNAVFADPVQANCAGRTVGVEHTALFVFVTEAVVTVEAIRAVFVSATLGGRHAETGSSVAGLTWWTVVGALASARVLASEIDTAARFGAVEVVSAIGASDASIGHAGPTVVTVRVGAAANRLAETELAPFVVRALIVIRACGIEETDVANAEGPLGTVFVRAAFPDVQALVADAGEAAAAITVVATLQVSLALTREWITDLTGRTIAIVPTFRRVIAATCDTFGVGPTVTILSTFDFLLLTLAELVADEARRAVEIVSTALVYELTFTKDVAELIWSALLVSDTTVWLWNANTSVTQVFLGAVPVKTTGFDRETASFSTLEASLALRVHDALESRNTLSVDTLFPGWTVAVSLTFLGRYALATVTLRAFGTVTIDPTHFVVEALPADAALPRAAVPIKTTLVARVDAQAGKTLLWVRAVPIVTTLASEAALVANTTEPTFALVVRAAFGPGVAETDIAFLVGRAVLISLALRRRHVDTQSV